MFAGTECCGRPCNPDNAGMRKLIVSNIVSVDGFCSGPNDDVMAMPFDEPFDDYNAERLRAADTLLLGCATTGARARRRDPAHMCHLTMHQILI